MPRKQQHNQESWSPREDSVDSCSHRSEHSDRSQPREPATYSIEISVSPSLSSRKYLGRYPDRSRSFERERPPPLPSQLQRGQDAAVEQYGMPNDTRGRGHLGDQQVQREPASWVQQHDMHDYDNVDHLDPSRGPKVKIYRETAVQQRGGPNYANDNQDHRGQPYGRQVQRGSAGGVQQQRDMANNDNNEIRGRQLQCTTHHDRPPRKTRKPALPQRPVHNSVTECESEAERGSNSSGRGRPRLRSRSR